MLREDAYLSHCWAHLCHVSAGVSAEGCCLPRMRPGAQLPVVRGRSGTHLDLIKPHHEAVSVKKHTAGMGWGTAGRLVGRGAVLTNMHVLVMATGG
jgi:hypothetical protein